MTYQKHWTHGGKEMIRNKPPAGDNGDYLDSINDQWSDVQHAQHDEGECGGLDDHCPWCEADKQAELEDRHYQRHTFDQINRMAEYNVKVMDMVFDAIFKPRKKG